MNDEEFLDYIYWHSQTERALFSAEQCRRLFELAERSFPEPNMPDTAWRSMEFHDIKHLVAAGRERVQKGL